MQEYERPDDNPGIGLEPYNTSRLQDLEEEFDLPEDPTDTDMIPFSGDGLVSPEILAPDIWTQQWPPMDSFDFATGPFSGSFGNFQGSSPSFTGGTFFSQQRNQRTDVFLLDELERYMASMNLAASHLWSRTNLPDTLALQTLYSPHLNALLDTRAPHIKTLFTVIFAFCNNIVRLENLMVSVVHYFNGLGTRQLCQMLNSLPKTHAQAFQRGLFWAAIEVGAVNIVKVILSRDFDPDMVRVIDGFPYTPLERSCVNECPGVTTALLRQAVHDEKYPPSYEGCLDKLIRKAQSNPNTMPSADVEIFQLLLNNGMTLELDPDRAAGLSSIMNPRLYTAIANTAAGQNLDTLRKLHFLFGALERCDHDTATQLVPAVLKRERNEDPGYKAQVEDTLHDVICSALYKGHTNVFWKLLRLGAKPSACCFAIAIQCSNATIVQYLLETDLPLVLGGGRRSTYGNHLTWGSQTPPYITHEIDLPIIQAIRRENMEVLGHFFSHGLLDELRDETDVLVQCICTAAEVGNMHILDTLLSLWSSYPRQPRTTLSDRWTSIGNAVTSAITNGHKYLMWKLLDHDIIPAENALCAAIRTRDCESIDLVLDIYLQSPMRHYGTSTNGEAEMALHLAVVTGDSNLVQNLISAGFSTSQYWEIFGDGALFEVGSMNRYGTYSLLATAILCGNQTIVDILLKKDIFEWRCPQRNASKAKIPMPGDLIITPLVAAVRTRNESVLEKLLAHGVNPCDAFALNETVSTRDAHFTKLLLNATIHKHPADKRGFGKLALMTAIAGKDCNMLALLLRHTSATQEWSINDTKEAFGEAILIKDSRMIELFLERRTDLNYIARMTSGYQPHMYALGPLVWHTPLLQAITTGQLSIVRMIVEAGAKIDMPAKLGIKWTPLQAAVEHGALDIVYYLLEQGAEPNQAPAIREGRTALQLAAEKGFIGIAALLIERRADVNAPAARLLGRTAFEGAAEYGRFDMLMFLSEHAVDIVSDGGKQYQRALLFAKTNGHTEVVSLVESMYAEARSRAREAAVDRLLSSLD